MIGSRLDDYFTEIERLRDSKMTRDAERDPNEIACMEALASFADPAFPRLCQEAGISEAVQRIMPFGLGAVRARFEYGRFSPCFFEPDESQPPALVFPITEGTRLIDLAAANLKTGDVGLWTGRAHSLGAELIAPARAAKQPLRVFQSVGGWIAAGRDGLVILDLAAALPELLAMQLVAENRTHAQELNKANVREACRGLPEILVVAHQSNKAAA